MPTEEAPPPSHRRGAHSPRHDERTRPTPSRDAGGSGAQRGGSGAQRGGSGSASRGEYRRLYARHAATRDSRTSRFVLPSIAALSCVVGCALVAIAARGIDTARLVGVGALCVLAGLGVALRPRRAGSARLHLVKGRILSLEPDAGSALVEVHRRLRLRPDGMVRHDPPLEKQLRLRVDPELARDLEDWVGGDGIELVATTEGTAIALYTPSRSSQPPEP